MTTTPKNEERTVGASYIVNFFQEVNLLTHNYVQYRNLHLELKSKYQGQMESLNDDEKNIMTESLQRLRYYAEKCYIEYKVILSSTKQTPNPKLDESVRKFRSSFVIDLDSMEGYVSEMNRLLVHRVMKSLLENSQDIIGDLYQDAQSKPATPTVQP